MQQENFVKFVVKEIIELKELNQLKEDLKELISQTYRIYGALDCRIRYGKLDKTPLRFFRAYGDFQSFVFVSSLCTSKRFRIVSGFWDCDKIKKEELRCLLSNLPNYDWNEPFIFHCSTLSIKQQVSQVWKEELEDGRNFLMEEDSSISDQLGVRLFISNEDIRIPQLPSECYSLRLLTASAASQMLAHWEYSFTETQEGLEELLSKFPSFGIFYRNQQTENEELVAWTHQYICGMIGMTFTMPSHRRQGLGAIVTLAQADLIYAEGRTPIVLTEIDNEQSINFHKKIGFHIIERVYRVICKPTNNG